MRLSSWLNGLRASGPFPLVPGRRRERSARDQLWSQPHVRRLEPRRVLNASVTNLLVPTSAVEGDTVYAAAEATGEGELRFDWTVSQDNEQIAQGTGPAFQFQADDDGTYSISVQLTDGDLTTDVATALIDVTALEPNVETTTTGSGSGTAVLPGGVEGSAPENLVLQPVSMLNEGQSATLRLSFNDPDTSDLHTVLINWGDGTPVQSVELGEGQMSLAISHLYADDNPTDTPQDVNQINVTVIDSTEQSTSGSTSVTVKNVAPEISFIDPVDPIDLGDTATLRFEIADAGALDIHTVDIDWGDGTSTSATLPVGATDPTFTHPYVTPPPGGADFYTVQITVADDDGQSVDDTTTIDVTLGLMNLNFGFVGPVDENGLATLRFSFTDSRPEEQHTATVDWGDGQTSLFVLPVGDRNLTTTHRYRDDNPTGTAQDTYTIGVTVNDSGEGSITNSTTVVVSNLAPTALVTEMTPMVNEGGTAFLNVRFADEGLFDVHTVTIDWGDGNTTVETLPVGTRDRTFAHPYGDDDPTLTAEDTYTVSITVADDDGGEVTGTDSILVKNVAPSALVTELPMMVNEGEPAQLDVSFADGGLLDEHTVTIDWGDGSVTTETVPVGARDASFSHVYDDVAFNGAGEVTFDVLVTVADDDGGQVMTSDPIVVKNTAPTSLITTLTNMIDEGGTARLDVQFADANEFDVHTITVDWGDGSTTVETLPVGARDRTFLHVYRDDNPTGTTQDVYPVQVTVDDGNQSISASDSILVKNVAPTALVTELAPMIVEGDTVLMNVRFADVGIFDVHTVTIDWGDGNTTVDTLPVGTRDRTFAHRYFDDDPTATPEDTYNVSITVMDDDGGSVSGSDSIMVKNAAPSALMTELPMMVNEGESVQLDVSFADVGTLDVHTVTIDWGDGNTTVETLSVGSRDGSFSHVYDDVEFMGASEVTFDVLVTVADDDGGQVMTTDSIVVKNTAPTALITTFTNMINEGSTARLDVQFADENQLDVHTVTVDWGDGSTTVETLPVGARDRTFLHVYRDDNPTGTAQDVYPVLVTVSDGNQSLSASDSILVKNVAPSALVTEIAPMIVEGDTVLMNVRFADVGIFDVHTVTIDWGDGNTTVDTLPVGTRDRTFAHQYLDDNPSLTSEDLYTVSISVMDDDGGSVSGSDSILVKNDPPSGLDLELTPEILEHATAELVVRFDDAGTLDTHTVTIDWGDGTMPTTETLPVGTREHTFSHQYLDDNPSGTMMDTYAVAVTVMDDDLGTTSGTASIVIVNDAPRNLEIVLSPVTGSRAIVAHDSHTSVGQGEIDPGSGGSIAGVKFEDLNGNGVRDMGLVRGDEPDVVFVIDVSGSTSGPFVGSSVGDLNNDGLTDTILDAQIAGFSALTNQLITLGFSNTAQIGIVAFSDAGMRVDMDPTTPGIQSAIMPNADSNGDGVLDVIALLEGLSSGGTTNFEGALAEAAGLLRDLGTAPENGNVIFLSDGFPNSDAFDDEVADLETLAGNLRAFGVGSGASLASLQMIDSTASIFTTTDELLAAFGGLSSGGGTSTEFSEPGLAGVQVYLDFNDNGMLDSNEPVALTLDDDLSTMDDETGIYRFTSLAPGTYVVREVVPAGFMQTTPSGDGAHLVTLVTDEARTGLDFGNQQGSMLFEDGMARLEINFDDDGTLDVHTVTIDWGDGTTPTTQTLNVGARSGTFFHQYFDDEPSGTPQDTYVVTVTVADDDAKQVTGTQSIVVKNIPPVLTATMPSAADEGDVVALVGSFTDVGTLDTHTGMIEWGDGMQTMLDEMELNENGTLAANHVFADDGVYEVKVSVMDKDGGMGTQSFFVTVHNVEPKLTVVGDQKVSVGEEFTIIDMATFSDPGFDNPKNPHHAPDGSHETFYFEIFWGDGSMMSGTIPGPDIPKLDHDGSAGDPTLGSIDGTHRYALAGTYTVTVRLADDDMLAAAGISTASSTLGRGIDGNFVTASFTITVDEIIFVPPQNNTDEPDAFLFDFGEGGVVFDSSGDELDFTGPQNGSVQISVQVPDLRALAEELAASPDRFLLLQVINIDGTPGETYRLDPKVLLNLRQFFSSLPDNDYEVYVVQPDLPDRKDWRLVVKATVRGSQPVDATDESDGAQDKPPVEESRIEIAPTNQVPMLELVPGSFAPNDENSGAMLEMNDRFRLSQVKGAIDVDSMTDQTQLPQQDGALPAAMWEDLAALDRPYRIHSASRHTLNLIPVIGLAAAGANPGWSERVRATMAEADGSVWRRLGAAGRRSRRIFRLNRP